MIGQTINYKKSIYDISYEDVAGKTISMKRYEGKKILIVNVASKCGYTPQYVDLQNLYSEFLDKVEVLAIPCNDFEVKSLGQILKLINFVKLIMELLFQFRLKEV